MEDQNNNSNNASNIDTSTESEITDEDSKEQKYIKLIHLMEISKPLIVSKSKVEMFEQMAKQFSEVSGYKDSDSYIEKCNKFVIKTKKELTNKIYEGALKKKNNAIQSQDYREAAQEFRKIGGYLNADELAEECDKIYQGLEKKATGKRLIRFSFIVLCFIAILMAANTSFVKYYTANAFMKINSYSNAVRIYSKLDNYKDTKKRITVCEYLSGLELKENGQYPEAEKAFIASGNYKDSKEQLVNIEKLILKSSQAGDLVSVGKYEWEIIDINNNQVFLMIKTALPGMAYHSSFTDVTWETSTLRQWLNSDFMNATFSEPEKNNIILTEVRNIGNTVYGTDGGSDTQDYVYLMSMEEAVKYNSLFSTFKSNCWLRSPGNLQNSAAFLSVDKSVMDYGYAVNSDKMNVRPVMWFSLD